MEEKRHYYYLNDLSGIFTRALNKIIDFNEIREEEGGKGLKEEDEEELEEDEEEEKEEEEDARDEECHRILILF